MPLDALRKGTYVLFASWLAHVRRADSRPNNARIPHGLLRLTSLPRVEVDTLSRVIVVDPYDVDIGSGRGTQPDAFKDKKL